jgi:hypothetical protein
MQPLNAPILTIANARQRGFPMKCRGFEQIVFTLTAVRRPVFLCRSSFFMRGSGVEMKKGAQITKSDLFVVQPVAECGCLSSPQEGGPDFHQPASLRQCVAASVALFGAIRGEGGLSHFTRKVCLRLYLKPYSLAGQGRDAGMGRN